MNRQWISKELLKLLNTPSPTGFCHIIMAKLQETFKELGYTMTYTNKGNGTIMIPGLDNTKTIGIAAHVDTLGAMVRSIKSNGTLAFTTVGGYTMHSVEGEYVTIYTREGKTYTGTILNTEPSVHVHEGARTQERKIDNMEIRLDEVVKSKEDVAKLGIETGDFVALDARAILTDSGFIKSRHLDDKAGVAAILGFLKTLKDEKLTPKFNLAIIISTYEEVGHGSSSLPEGLSEVIAVDMGAMGSDLTCTEQQVSICPKDSSGPYDFHMTSALIEAAKNHDINYAVDIYPYYGSDVSAALRAGHDIKGALIGPGVHASHHMERTHLDGIVQTAQLLKAYLV
jgi:putative aminopeptidase FrvX